MPRLTAAHHPGPAPLVLAGPDEVGRTAAALIANRLRARPRLRMRGGETRERLRPEQVGDAAPLDLAVLGLDPEGRVMLDEPGSSAPSGVEDPSALLGARELLLLVTGASRARALREMLLARAPSSPAALLRAHPRVAVICDTAAAQELRHVAAGDHVCIVLGHRDPGFSHEHRISRESLGRVHRAEWVTERRPTRAVVLTGYTSTGGLSEAEQMWAAWRAPGVPALLEVAGRNTAGNAACSLPIVLALGGVREVTVVTSGWHLRAPYMFAPWRRHGLRVRFAVDWRGDWPRMLAREFHEARVAPRERRSAFSEVAPS